MKAIKQRREAFDEVVRLIRAHSPEISAATATQYGQLIQRLRSLDYTGDGDIDDLVERYGFAWTTAAQFRGAWRKWLAANGKLAPAPARARPANPAVQWALGLTAVEPARTTYRAWRRTVQETKGLVNGDEVTQEAARRAYVPPATLAALGAVVAAVGPAALDLLPHVAWTDTRLEGDMAVVRTRVERGHLVGTVNFVIRAADLAAIRTWASPSCPEAPLVPLISGATRPMPGADVRWLVKLARKHAQPLKRLAAGG